jgi:hypothetical protein
MDRMITATRRYVADLAAVRSARAFFTWVEEHDDRNSFVFLYLALSVVLSFAAGLFWLIALVAVHTGFELYRHRDLAPGRRVSQALFGIKLDVTLVLLALALALYIDVLFAVLGLRALPRAGAMAGQASSRVPSLRRIVRTALMLADEVVRISAYFVTARGIAATASHGRAGAGETRSPWAAPWSLGTTVVVALGLAALFLLVGAPWLSGNGWEGTMEILRHELNPRTN